MSTQTVQLFSSDIELQRQLIEIGNRSNFDLLIYPAKPTAVQLKNALPVIDLRSNEFLPLVRQLQPVIEAGMLVFDGPSVSNYPESDIPAQWLTAVLPLKTAQLAGIVESLLYTNPASGSSDHASFGEIVGASPEMQRVYEMIKTAAASDIPVLINGETGTGKDLVAQEIHQRSMRRDEAYVPVNLGSLPSQLIASELFGHQKGAFTGAISTYRGRFEQANNGTIFLDEIDSIDEKVQVSLLRLIEQKRFTRLGGKKTIRVNVRVLTATNADIDDLLDDDSFRNDLFYRLDVFRINLPPLRYRLSDISILSKHFIKLFNNAHKKAVREIKPEAVNALMRYHWPGNIRELKNVIQRSMLLSEGEAIRIQNLPARFRNAEVDAQKLTFSLGTPLLEVERQMVLRALAASNNNRTEAARLLGISRRAIYNKLKKHNIR